MVNRGMETTWKILLFAVSAALLTVGAIAALQPHQHSVIKPIMSYNEVLDYKVVAYPKSNNPFGSQPSIDPPTIYTNVTQSVNFTIQYQLSKNLAVNTNLTLAERVYLVSANPDWTDAIYSNLTYYSIGPSQTIVRSIPVQPVIISVCEKRECGEQERGNPFVEVKKVGDLKGYNKEQCKKHCPFHFFSSE